MPHDRTTDLPQVPIATLDKEFIKNLKASMRFGPPPTQVRRVRKVFVVTRPDHGSKFCVFRQWEDVEAEFDGAEMGDSITVTLKFMTQEELDAMPDFEGW